MTKKERDALRKRLEEAEAEEASRLAEENDADKKEGVKKQPSKRNVKAKGKKAWRL